METCTETERVRRLATGARGDGREVITVAKAERTAAWRAHLGGGGESRPGGDGGVARSDTCDWKRKGGGGFGQGLSGWRARRGDVGQRRRASDAGCGV
jgi:hypothetical protein